MCLDPSFPKAVVINLYLTPGPLQSFGEGGQVRRPLTLWAPKEGQVRLPLRGRVDVNSNNTISSHFFSLPTPPPPPPPPQLGANLEKTWGEGGGGGGNCFVGLGLLGPEHKRAEGKKKKGGPPKRRRKPFFPILN